MTESQGCFKGHCDLGLMEPKEEMAFLSWARLVSVNSKETGSRDDRAAFLFSFPSLFFFLKRSWSPRRLISRCPPQWKPLSAGHVTLLFSALKTRKPKPFVTFLFFLYQSRWNRETAERDARRTRGETQEALGGGEDHPRVCGRGPQPRWAPQDSRKIRAGPLVLHQGI